MVFDKFKAKLDMKLHFRSSRGYFRAIKGYGSDIEKTIKKMKDSEHLILEGELSEFSGGRFPDDYKITEGFKNLFHAASASYHLLHGLSETSMVIQNRLLDDLRNLANHLRDLMNSDKINEEIKHDLKLVRAIIQEARGKILNIKREARDLTKGKQKIAYQSLRGEERHAYEIYMIGRKGKRKHKAAQRSYKSSLSLIKYIEGVVKKKDSTIDGKKVAKLRDELVSLRNGLAEEWGLLALASREHTKLVEEIQDQMEKWFDHLRVYTQKYPFTYNKFYNKMRNIYGHLQKEIETSEKEQYRRAQVLEDKAAT